jgi:hypothetical protein
MSVLYEMAIKCISRIALNVDQKITITGAASARWSHVPEDWAKTAVD